LIAASKELRRLLSELAIDVVVTHGYKAGLLGLWAGRKLGLPVVAVSRGWTAESWKVRLYEKLDRWALRHMDAVVCVSHGQAAKVCRAGVAEQQLVVIHNAIRTARFDKTPTAEDRDELLRVFPTPPRFLLGAAGRLSPEKGFDVLVEAARQLRDSYQRVGFGVLLFGEGSLRAELQKQIDDCGLASNFILAGFTNELDRWMPHFDLFVQSSHTEGLPNVLLEAAAAGVPVVATDVGGTSEVVADGETGQLVPADDSAELASVIDDLLSSEAMRATMARNAPRHVGEHFTFAAQADAYRELLATLVSRRVNR
jgi:glycosyltransferase involved in cell wall biosynthesis